MMPMARMFWRTTQTSCICGHRHLAGALFERFKSGLSDLVVMAFSVLNHKYWPYVDLKQEKPDY